MWLVALFLSLYVPQILDVGGNDSSTFLVSETAPLTTPMSVLKAGFEASPIHSYIQLSDDVTVTPGSARNLSKAIITSVLLQLLTASAIT